MYRKCCVLSCPSKQDTVLMHKIPRNADRQRFWLNIIDNPVLNDLSDSQYCCLKVCEKHFETRFKSRLRLRYGAYPSLFTPEEISKGVPHKTLIIERNYCKSDHSYFKEAFHNDHSYTKKVSILLKPGDTSLNKEVNDEINSDKQKPDNDAKTIDATASAKDAEVSKTDALSREEDTEEPSACDDDIEFSPPSPRCASYLPRRANPPLPPQQAEPSAIDDEDTEEPSACDDDIEFSPPSPRCASYLPRRAPPSPLQRKEGDGARTLFSWQKSELIPADDIEEPLTVAELEEQSGVSLYCDENPAPPPAPLVPAPSVKEVEYRCKDCGEIIDGFQFWCVQCVGGALCGACDARGEHNRHYVLRAPPDRPYRQTQVVLATIRHQLQNENLLTQLGPDGGVKLEVKEEPPEECRVPAPDPLADDPLRHTPAPHTSPHGTRAHETIKKYTALQPCKRPRLADFIEQDFAATESPQTQVNLTHEPTPQEHILISFDDIPDQLEFFEEEAERIEETESEGDVTGDDEYTEIEHLDDTDSGDPMHEDAVSTDSIIAEDAVSVNSRIDDDAVSVDSRIEETEIVTSVVDETDGVDTIVASESILKDIITSRKRRVDDTRQLPMRGSPKYMIRTLSSEAVVELKPLSSLQISKWTADIKKRRK